MATLEAMRDREYRANKFAAALKGIDLDAQSSQASMDRVREEMERLEQESGLKPREQQSEFAAFGIAVVEGD